MTRPLLLLACALLLAPGLRAQEASVFDDPRFIRQAERGLDLLYDMQFEQADRVFDALAAQYPNHPAGPFLQALNTWWLILLDLNDTSHDRAFYEAMDKVIDRANRRLRRSRRDFDAMFFKGAALGFRGRLYSNRRDWLRAANDGKRAMDYVFAIADEEPTNADYYFGKGIYDYYAAVLPKRYAWSKPFMAFFPRGDARRGLNELKRAHLQGRFLQTEAAYFLLQIYYVFENDYDKSVEYVTWLRKAHPNNSFFHTIEGRIYARWGRWDKVKEIFSEVASRSRRSASGYTDVVAQQAYYYLARHALLERDLDMALRQLQQIERLARGQKHDTTFKILGRLRQGMVYDQMGRRDLAERRYREVLKMRDIADSHQMAKRYLDRPYGG